MTEFLYFKAIHWTLNDFNNSVIICLNVNKMASESAKSSGHHVLDILWSYSKSFALFAALNNGVFEYLEKNEGGRTAQQTANDLCLDGVATTILLDNCTSSNLLVKEVPKENMEEAIYRNSDETKRHLLPQSPESLYKYVIFEARVMSKLSVNFEHALKEGTSQWQRTFGMTSEEAFNNLYKNKESLIEFEEAMKNRIEICKSSLLETFDLSGFSHLCDLGGDNLKSAQSSMHSIIIY